MTSPFYIVIWVAGICGLSLLWDKGIKPLALGLFRERIFELRFSLFRLGMTGELPFDSKLYRRTETLLCGLLRFAHRVTFMTYIFSKAEQEKDKKLKDHVDVTAEINLEMSRLAPEARKNFGKIMRDVSRAILLYMAFTSMFFLAASIPIALLRVLGIWRSEKAKEVSNVIEQEAYRSASEQPLTLATA